MRNAMQLKVVIRNMAKEKKIRAQLVLQKYMLERFPERVSLSAYRDYYDIYILTKLQRENIDPPTLRETLVAAAERRGSVADGRGLY